MGDKNKLFNDWAMEMVGCVELNHLYEHYKFAEPHEKTTLSLKAIYEAVMGRTMRFKSKKVTLSNWAVEGALSSKQISYAADDALVCHELFFALVKDQIVPQGHSEQQKRMKQLIADVSYA